MRWVQERREQPASLTPHKFLVSAPSSLWVDRLPSIQNADQPALPAARRLGWLFLEYSDQLDPQDLQLRDQLLRHPTLLLAC